MKNYLLIGLVGLLTLFFACSHEDDNLNKVTKDEVIVLYDFTLNVNSPLGNSVEGAKDSFFYIVGTSKVISRYGSCGKSTDISSANWTRTIDYKTDGGDGLGGAIGGLLDNVDKDDSNTPDGVAYLKDYRGIVQENSSITLFSIDENGDFSLKLFNSRGV
ncbi:hypothetical protein KCTC52924_01101 [Arenibacter antarcticus]|uniref:Uncharacterized protein n=1 Tax=Arenibacter antarcticus TaxID=2040469 RepID=A0ABW5VBT3_9FLAO|nr:hypothetical protein [Arenibacter sp. H213]